MPPNPVVTALLFVWSIVYLPYALIVIWASTGPDALAGPSSTTDNIISAVWLLLSVLQLYIAVALNRHYKPWLFLVSVSLAALSFGSVILGPILALLGAG